MDLKSTLNLPDADFTIPMKADLPKREPGIQARWDELGIYERIMEARRDAPTFILHDGPPYTNGPIHIGTALNKVLKDFVFKSRTVMGYRSPNVPGFDSHGIPIEQAVMKKMREKGEKFETSSFRKAAREHSRHFIGVQTEQFKRLGVFGMWDRPYNSMDFKFEAEILRIFKRLVENGYVYRGLRPVLWSPSCQTALADTEIVYQDHTSESIFVRFPLLEDVNKLFTDLKHVYTIIWTTTPWTIPANLAVAYHPGFTYVVAKADGAHYIVLEELLERTMAKCGFKEYTIVKRLKGAELEGTKFKHPVFERESVAVLAEYVTTEDGTGVVHTAPGHGREDFQTGQKYGLPVLCPVNEKGILTEEAGEFKGLPVKKANEVIVERLRELGMLLHAEPFIHSYPHGERDGLPVIFRATEQWFVGMDLPYHLDPSKTLREAMLEQIQDVKWFPATGQARLTSMIAGRPDWCISRQRPWGVGIPVFYGKESGEPVLDPALIEVVAQLVEKEGSDAWYARPAEDILPKGYKHPRTGETEFGKEVDVFDVWFDSGCTSLCVLEGNVEPRWKEEWPSDLYLEGSDQHRGWFNVSLIIGMGTRGHAPYRQVVTHGWVVDEKGMKMSKRLGNVVDPVKVSDHYGADILRVWVASVNYEDDVPCSDHLLKTAGDTYRRIRNTFRYLLSNLNDYDPDAKPELLELDRWVMEKTDALTAQVLDAYARYEFTAAINGIHNFCVNELSAFYLDAIKDRMYCDGADWASRRSAQVACQYVLSHLVKLAAPILAFTAEEVYPRIPGIEHLASVHMESIDRVDGETIKARDASDLHVRVEKLYAERAWVFSEFEKWKAESGVKDSQDVVATLITPEADVLLSFGGDLANLFKMSEVEVQPGDEQKVTFDKSPYAKCERSRLRRADVEVVTWQGKPVPLSARDRKVLGV